MAITEKILKTKEHRERSPRSKQKLKVMYLMKIFMQKNHRFIFSSVDSKEEKRSSFII